MDLDKQMVHEDGFVDGWAEPTNDRRDGTAPPVENGLVVEAWTPPLDMLSAGAQEGTNGLPEAVRILEIRQVPR
jgi:hypothetical protein